MFEPCWCFNCELMSCNSRPNCNSFSIAAGFPPHNRCAVGASSPTPSSSEIQMKINQWIKNEWYSRGTHRTVITIISPFARFPIHSVGIASVMGSQRHLTLILRIVSHFIVLFFLHMPKGKYKDLAYKLAWFSTCLPFVIVRSFNAIKNAAGYAAAWVTSTWNSSVVAIANVLRVHKWRHWWAFGRFDTPRWVSGWKILGTLHRWWAPRSTVYPMLR